MINSKNNSKNYNNKRKKRSLSLYIKKNSKNKLNESNNYRSSLMYKNSDIIEMLNERFNIMRFTHDNEVDQKDLNTVPYTQAIRIDHRNYFQMLFSVLAHEIQIIDIFYYRSRFNHLSIALSIYIFESCLDLTLNCILYTDDVVSEKYKNNGSIEFFSSLSLSFISNIIASLIAFIIGKLANYADVLEFIVKDSALQRDYLLNIVKFKKYLNIKMSGFFLVELIINFGMCYYLMIFCTIYHKTQGSIMKNYALGIAQSMIKSFGLSIIVSLMRYLSLTYRWKSFYNSSKYLFENF